MVSRAAEWSLGHAPWDDLRTGGKPVLSGGDHGGRPPLDAIAAFTLYKDVKRSANLQLVLEKDDWRYDDSHQ